MPSARARHDHIWLLGSLSLGGERGLGRVGDGSLEPRQFGSRKSTGRFLGIAGYVAKFDCRPRKSCVNSYMFYSNRGLLAGNGCSQSPTRRPCSTLQRRTRQALAWKPATVKICRSGRKLRGRTRNVSWSPRVFPASSWGCAELWHLRRCLQSPHAPGTPVRGI
jgi:hypothetical protein